MRFNKDQTFDVQLTETECNILMSVLLPDRAQFPMPHEHQAISFKLKHAADCLKSSREAAMEFLSTLTEEEIDLIEDMRANKGRTDR